MEMEQLEQLVFDEGLPVTVAQVVRRMKLSVADATRLLSDFLENHKQGTPQISATYVVTGEVTPLQPPSASAGKPAASSRSKVTMCKAGDLEKCRAGFTTVRSCSIYSVHAFEVKSLQPIFNADWMDQEPALPRRRQEQASVPMRRLGGTTRDVKPVSKPPQKKKKGRNGSKKTKEDKKAPEKGQASISMFLDRQ